MKKLLLIAATVALFTSIQSQADFYAGGAVGWAINDGSITENSTRSKYRDSTMYTLSGGIVFPLPLLDIRAEAEYIHNRPKTSSVGKEQLDALMVNVTGVIPLVPIVDPYVGLGLGYAHYDHNYTTAFQALAGVEFAIPETPITLGAEYRYMKLTESCGNKNNYSKYHNNALLLKVKYTF